MTGGGAPISTPMMTPHPLIMGGIPWRSFSRKASPEFPPRRQAGAQYHVLPQEAFLTSIKCVVSSIKGKIALEMRKTASEYSIRLTSPANTKAIVGVPKGSFSKLTTIEVDGTTIWDGAYKGGVTQQFSFWRCARWLGRLGFASWRGQGSRCSAKVWSVGLPAGS